MSVYIESVLQYEDVRLLMEGAAESGVVRRTQLTELIETHELDALETEALYREPTPSPRRLRLHPRRFRPPSRRPRTRCSSSCAKPGDTRCSRPLRRSSCRSGSSGATWRPSSG
jgi:hypothetical protein